MKRKKSSPWIILLAIVLAIVIGTISGKEASFLNIRYYDLYQWIGTLFLNALTLIVVPLVSSSIISGIAKIGNEKDFSRIGGKTFIFYLGTSLIAILIGLFFVNLIDPGLMGGAPSLDRELIENVEERVTTTEGKQIANLFLQIIPPNIFEAFSKGQMLSIIFFSLIFGYVLSKIESNASAVLIAFWQGVFQAMIQITHIFMKFLPLGVFCLVAKVFAETGLASLARVGLFTVTVLAGLATFMFVILPILLKVIAKVKPVRHFRAMAPALVTAFSTSSSSATLPITMDCVEKRAGVSNRITSLVIPLGTSINMSGSALYECVAAMFVAQAYGIEISFLTQVLVVFLSLLTSIGVAGVPSASLVAILIILKAIGLPPEGLGLFIAVDRILDMCRTTINVFSDSCCAILVASTEGEHVLSEPVVE